MNTIATLREQVYGKSSRDRRSESLSNTLDGARAALETFYFAFNNRSLEVFDAIWAPDELIQLNNPVGGIRRGHADIHAVYEKIFNGPARVWVEFYDFVEYPGADTVVFAGRERGEFANNGESVTLAIRTSRVFRFLGPSLGWRQVHHHGSIDDAALLERYQRAVKGQPVATDAVSTTN